ncbi:MAG: type II restriction endonuclease [Planctomycetota bacterium]
MNTEPSFNSPMPAPDPALLEEAQQHLEVMLTRFGGDFPPTSEFSDFARATAIVQAPVDDPDEALMTWIEWEYALFRVLEKHMVTDQLEAGFEDVDQFLSYSLSVQNRRKSRTGHALENHLIFIFERNGLRFSNGCRTENNSRPDFLFPGEDEYHVSDFDPARLTMLGAKTTCKDRWRQVLAEAERADDKFLITREEGISENQTDEMRSHNLQLVIPRRLQATYTLNQRAWLFDLRMFIQFVRNKQI